MHMLLSQTRKHLHLGVLQAPHFQGEAEVASKAADSLGSCYPAPDPEVPCTQTATIGLQCSPPIKFPKNLDATGFKSSNF